MEQYLIEPSTVDGVRFVNRVKEEVRGRSVSEAKRILENFQEAAVVDISVLLHFWKNPSFARKHCGKASGIVSLLCSSEEVVAKHFLALFLLVFSCLNKKYYLVIFSLTLQEDLENVARLFFFLLWKWNLPPLNNRGSRFIGTTGAQSSKIERKRFDFALRQEEISAD